MISRHDLYEFVFRGLLTEEALDQAGRIAPQLAGYSRLELAEALSIALLDPDLVRVGNEMATVYAAIAAFENSVRRLAATVLIDAFGDQWWETGFSESAREKAEKRREEEDVAKWHAQRGDNLINYTDLTDLGKVIQNNWAHFEPHIRSQEWAKAIFHVIERSRNVIMHSGTLDREDIERLGINIRDWVKQVGA